MDGLQSALCRSRRVDGARKHGLYFDIWETEKGAIGQKSPGPELANRGAGGGTSFIHGTGGPIPHAACHRVTGWPLRR
jgi:hypothetical protein